MKGEYFLVFSKAHYACSCNQNSCFIWYCRSITRNLVSFWLNRSGLNTKKYLRIWVGCFSIFLNFWTQVLYFFMCLAIIFKWRSNFDIKWLYDKNLFLMCCIWWVYAASKYHFKVDIKGARTASIDFILVPWLSNLSCDLFII